MQYWFEEARKRRHQREYDEIIRKAKEECRLKGFDFHTVPGSDDDFMKQIDYFGYKITYSDVEVTLPYNGNAKATFATMKQARDWAQLHPSPCGFGGVPESNVVADVALAVIKVPVYAYGFLVYALAYLFLLAICFPFVWFFLSGVHQVYAAVGFPIGFMILLFFFHMIGSKK